MLVSGVQQSDLVMLMVSFDEREISILMKTDLLDPGTEPRSPA